MLLTAALFATALACPEPSCEVRLCEHNNRGGRCDTYGIGEYRNIGFQNNRASSIQLSEGCRAELYDGDHFRGQKVFWGPVSRGGGNMILNFNSYNPNMNDRISSMKVYRYGRRRRADAGIFADFKARDPLCEWILQDGLDTDWQFMTNENKDQEITNLVDYCETEFSDEEALDQCIFYVYAVAAFYNNDELVEDLKFLPEEETAETEYMRCGIVATKINTAIEEGKISGITMVPGIGGKPDTFELEKPQFESHPVFTSSQGVAETVISVGTMIAMVVSHAVIKVCRDFDAINHNYLLA